MNAKRIVLIVSLALGVGGAIGFTLGAFTGSGEQSLASNAAGESRSAQAHPADLARNYDGGLAAMAVASSTEGAPVSPEAAVFAEAAPTEIDVADGVRIASLTARLDADQGARRRLERELGEVKVALLALERRFASLAARNGFVDRSPQAAAAGNGGIDAGALVAAGFSVPEAEALAQRWGEQQMDLLYLRDQAIREGWLDTPRYEEAVQALRDSGPSLREELGEDGYDRFLHAAGRPNRVMVTSVFESSPGQIAGLQTGDTIVSYDGTPIRSGTDLRRATTGGAPDEPVTVQVLRDGEPLELSLLRGPIGIQMEAVSVAPD